MASRQPRLSSPGCPTRTSSWSLARTSEVSHRPSQPANIADNVAVYDDSAEYRVLPLENTLQSAVIETVDALLSTLGQAKQANGSTRPRSAVADTALQISHQLVGLKGATLADITHVRSHEQALGQSASWLSEHLPNAKREPWSSTAAAVASIMEEGDKSGAAICSKSAYENDKNRLERLADGTQGDPSEL